MGRPPSGVPHRKPIQVKLNDEERAICDREAKFDGLETSTWMRAIAVQVGRARAAARARARKAKKR